MGPGEQRRPGSDPYQSRVRALGALLVAPSRKTKKQEPGRIPEGRARARAPRSLRSRRRRSRSPAALCPPAGRGSRLPTRDKPLSESSASASREPPLSKYEQEGLTGSQRRRVCGAPEIRKGAGTSGRSLPELPDPACTSGAPSWRPQLPLCCSVFLRGADRLPCGTSPARSCHAFCSFVPHPFAKAPSPPSPSEPRTVCAETPSLTWATS